MLLFFLFLLCFRIQYAQRVYEVFVFHCHVIGVGLLSCFLGVLTPTDTKDWSVAERHFYSNKNV